MSDKVNQIVTLALLSPPVILIVIGLAIDLHLASRRNFHLICMSLQRSQCLSSIKRTWGEHGMISKLLAMFQLCGVMAITSRSIRKGMLDVKDVSAFPLHLKRKMVLSAWLGWLSFSWLIVAAIVL